MSISSVTQDIISTPKSGSLKQRTSRNLQMQLQMKQDRNSLTAKRGVYIMHKPTVRQIFQMSPWLLQKLLFLSDLKYIILCSFLFMWMIHTSFNPEDCLFSPFTILFQPVLVLSGTLYEEESILLLNYAHLELLTSADTGPKKSDIERCELQYISYSTLTPRAHSECSFTWRKRSLQHFLNRKNNSMYRYQH